MNWSRFVEEFKDIDRRNFLGEYLKWGSRFRDAYERTEPIDFEFNRLIIAGMGGSGIVGDIIRDFLEYEYGLITYVIKDSIVPIKLSRDDLFIGISFSGNTIETIDAVLNALKMNAKIVVVTTDGLLSKLAEEKGFKAVIIEPALAPRAGLPQMLGATLKLLSTIVNLKNEYIRIAEALDDDCKKYDISVKENRAYKLAYNMLGRLPVVYSHRKYRAVLHRIKSSINENAKMNAYYAVAPELYHNEIESYEEVIDPGILPILLMDDEENDILKYLSRYFEEFKIDYIYMLYEGKTYLEKMLRMITLFDIASIYLAGLRRIDPYEIKAINVIKKWRS